MAFNITQFKSTIDRFGGPARSSLFEVVISNYPFVNSNITARDFSFFCKTANIPSIALNTVFYEGVGEMPRNYPIGVTNQPFNAIFMLDSDHEILRFFHSWIQHVVNFGTRGGTFSEVDGKLPFEVGFREDYSCRIVIRHYSTEGDPNKFYEVILDGAFPITIGDIDLSWENNDSYLTLPVSFSYDRIEYSGERTGTPYGLFSRGNGLLNILGAVANFAGVVQQTVRQGFNPTSIQDAINRVTRLRNSFDNITNRF